MVQQCVLLKAIGYHKNGQCHGEYGDGQAQGATRSRHHEQDDATDQQQIKTGIGKMYDDGQQ